MLQNSKFSRFSFEPKFLSNFYFPVQYAVGLELFPTFGVQIFVLLAVLFHELGGLDLILFHEDFGSKFKQIEGLMAPLFEEVVLLVEKIFFGGGLGGDFFGFSEFNIVLVVFEF